ncbi:hypothetical protein [Roseibium sp.]|uniref:hypothetical protein n=1 Tax=Roseibium sp. TaxID=1936156 RepID=UPI003D1225A2
MLRALSVLLLVLFTSTALAWEFRASRVCELLHKDETASVRVVFDPAVPEYFIAITPNRPWMPGPVFSMRFDGPLSNTIATDRHVITPVEERSPLPIGALAMCWMDWNSTPLPPPCWAIRPSRYR